MAAATKQQLTAAPTTVDPKFEWAEKAGSYVLRLTLPGFRKDDFRVQVDGAGRLTVRGARPAPTGPGSLHKVFQLPSGANLDDIAGRFEAGVLTLTVPKRASSLAPAPNSIEEIKRKPDVGKETKAKEEEIAKEDALKKKAIDEATKKAQQEEEEKAKSRNHEQQKLAPAPVKPEEEVKPKSLQAEEAAKKARQHQKKEEEEASKSKQEQQKPAPAQVKKEEVKPKGAQAASAPPQKPAPVKKEEEMKPNAPQAATATPTPEKSAPKPEAATGAEKANAVVAPESLAERVRLQREEEQRANAAAASDKQAKAEQEKKKALAACVSGWKERAMGELKGLTDMKWAEGLTDMKWADGVVEAARKNKEVLVVGIAAFSIGFFVSQKFCRK